MTTPRGFAGRHRQELASPCHPGFRALSNLSVVLFSHLAESSIAATAVLKHHIGIRWPSRAIRCRWQTATQVPLSRGFLWSLWSLYLLKALQEFWREMLSRPNALRIKAFWAGPLGHWLCNQQGMQQRSPNLFQVDIAYKSVPKAGDWLQYISREPPAKMHLGS